MLNMGFVDDVEKILSAIDTKDQVRADNLTSTCHSGLTILPTP
jgi:superfamily II DNA/RNA helicase